MPNKIIGKLKMPKKNPGVGQKPTKKPGKKPKYKIKKEIEIKEEAIPPEEITGSY